MKVREVVATAAATALVLDLRRAFLSMRLNEAHWAVSYAAFGLLAFVLDGGKGWSAPIAALTGRTFYRALVGPGVRGVAMHPWNNFAFAAAIFALLLVRHAGRGTAGAAA